MEHEDPYHPQAPWSPRLKVKVARSRGLSNRCWLISQEQKAPGIPKVVGRLPTRRAIMCTRFDVKRSWVKVIRPINAETESVSLTNFKLGRWSVHALSMPGPAIQACEVGLLHAGGAYRVGCTRRRPQMLLLVLAYYLNSTQILTCLSCTIGYMK